MPASNVDRNSVMIEGTLRAINIPVAEPEQSEAWCDMELLIQCGGHLRDMLRIVGIM